MFTADLRSHRRIVTGYDPAGRPTVVSDGPAPVTLTSPGFDIVETWRVGALPARMDEAETVDGPTALDPVPGQVLIRYCHFAPASDAWEQDFKESMAAIGGADAVAAETEQPGTHTTDTVDHILIVYGEITLIVNGQAVDLVAGDVVVQNGTPHAWINKSDDYCVTLAVQVPADPTTRPMLSKVPAPTS